MNQLYYFIFLGGKIVFNFKDYEQHLTSTFTSIISSIITTDRKLNKLPASAGRIGATISDYLQEDFVNYVNGPQNSVSDELYNAEEAPKEKTKNPFDARCSFSYNGRTEEIWLDFKALNVDKVDSNPDIGTPYKVIKFIKEGNFYILFIIVYYDKDNNNNFKYTKYEGKYTNTYLLKDVSSSMRVNPKPQMQVNMKAKPEYRTREEFIELLSDKLTQSYERTEEKVQKRREELKDLKKDMYKANQTATNK